MMNIIIMNLEKIGFGMLMFMGAYLANMGLGAWRNVKIDGASFDWKKIAQSAVKFVVLMASMGLMSIVASAIPAYATFIGIEIGAEVMETIDAMVIVGAFMTATIRYIGDAITKVKDLLA
jgi:hypothetical protein|nr:MAG TPA: hypothetical protein [Caudoviricetes sp.]